MSLEMLLGKISKLTTGQFNEGEGDNLAQNNIQIPSGTKGWSTRVYNSTGIGQGVDIEVRGRFGIDSLSLLSHLLRKAKTIAFLKGVGTILARVTWSEDMLQKETRLGSVSTVELVSSYLIKNQKKSRTVFNSASLELMEDIGTRFMLSARVTGKQINFHANGDYVKLLPRIIQEISPQSMKLSVSADDMKRLMKNSSWFQKNLISFMIWLEKKHTEKRDGLFFNLENSKDTRSAEKRPVIFTYPVKALPRLSNAIGRQLFNREDNDETFIVTFSKKCRTCDEVLFDLKRIANITKDVRPEELFGIPLITEEEAKKLLNEEVQQVVESYKLIGGNIFNGYFGANSHILRGNLLKRLATELFGGDIVENLENMNPSEYILFLNRLGYRTKSLEISDYPYSDYPYPDYLIKQQHLLSFFCQSYEKTQYHLIQKFRKMYQNRPPKMVITGETEDIDFSNFKKMSLPDQASVSALLFHEPYNTGSDALSVVNAEHDTTYLYSRMSHVPNNTNFRELQTIACREVGIKFL